MWILLKKCNVSCPQLKQIIERTDHYVWNFSLCEYSSLLFLHHSLRSISEPSQWSMRHPHSLYHKLSPHLEKNTYRQFSCRNSLLYHRSVVSPKTAGGCFSFCFVSLSSFSYRDRLHHRCYSGQPANETGCQRGRTAAAGSRTKGTKYIPVTVLPPLCSSSCRRLWCHLRFIQIIWTPECSLLKSPLRC